MFKAALFDLDGVVFDTEPQYSIFWSDVCRKYHPEQPGLENKIKGQTLVEILDGYFNYIPKAKEDILQGLDAYESQMNYLYVDGFSDFIKDIRQRGILTALVTSSNIPKMRYVYEKHPEIKSCFDTILTAEDFKESKPSPDCYLQAAQRLKAMPSECVVFEDSFNGLRSGKAADMYVVGLSTTNTEEAISPFCNHVISDFSDFDFDKLTALI